MYTKIIAHRGNLNGPNEAEENKQDYILKAIAEGFDVEIDVWVKIINNKKEIYLGHDSPQYALENNLKFLFENKDKLWCHAKNIQALEWLKANNFNTFWHQEDNYTLTSKGFIWAYPNMPTQNGIYVLPERHNTVIDKNAIGVCTDYCYKYKELLKD